MIAMLRQVAQARMAMAVRPANGKLLSIAQPPTIPFKPDVLANCMLGTSLFGLLGICIVAMQERNTGQLRMPGQSESILSLPELGAIPAAPGRYQAGKAFTWLGLQGIGRPVGQAGGASNLSEAKRSSDIARVSYEQEASDISESFRAALFSILAGVCATCHCRVPDAWAARLPAASDDEMAKLDEIPSANDNSRLACQIKFEDSLDGLVLELQPDSLHPSILDAAE